MQIVEPWLLVFQRRIRTLLGTGLEAKNLASLLHAQHVSDAELKRMD